MAPLIVPHVLSGLSRAHVSNIRPHLMYDAVWSVAVLAAGSTASLLKNESMGQTLSQLGKLPTAFEGITGKVEWDSDGNRDMSGAAVSFVNVVSDRGGVVVQTVASWTPGGGTTLNPNMTITWGDGLQYPRLPGYQTNLGPRWGEWKVMLVGVAIGLSLCLGLAAVVFFRTKYTRLQSFNSPADPSTSLASKFRQVIS